MKNKLTLSDYAVVDLSHELHEAVPSWAGGCGFQSSIDWDYDKIDCRVMSYRLEAGIGTHIDAPSHFDPNGAAISELSVTDFVAHLCVIKVNKDLKSDFLLSVKDIENYEKMYGSIPEGSLVVADTGWARYWSCPKQYRNADETGKMAFPAFHSDAVKELLKRGIVGIGIDTLSPDGGNTEFPVHHLILPKGKYIIENLANLESVPESGSWIIALPPKIKGGAESPCRCIALVPS